MYDIGGTAGGVAAGRLAAADSTLRILVLEVGPDVEDDLRHTQPAVYPSHQLPTSRTVRFNQAHPSEALRGRAVVVPCGQCVGGGSSVNCKSAVAPPYARNSPFIVLSYTRGDASDYNDWETKYNNPGWGSRDLIPLLKKVSLSLSSNERWLKPL